MAETVGRVDFIADLDGSKLPAQARKLGEQIGASGSKAGKDYATNFDKGLTPRMSEALGRMEKMLGQKLVLKDDVMRRNSLAIRTFGRDGETSIDRLTNKIVAFGVQTEHSIRSAFGRGADNARNFWNSLDEGETRLHGLNLQWRDLSHNTRQWTLIIGAVLAGMQSLSVLGSALGSGLFAVGGALSGLVIGGAAAAAVFGLLAKDVADLPPELQGAATQFRALGRELVGVRDIIGSAAIAEMPFTFARLSGTVRSLTPEFGSLGTAVGKVFDDFSRGLDEGSAGFTEVRGLIRNATDDFPALAKAAGTWTVSLLRGINKANPLVDQLIGYVQELGNRFDRFTKSDSFSDWISRSSTTFTRFGTLLDAVGRSLNDLVTPESIVRTQAFLGNLTDFMPNLTRMLDILGRLDVFGLAAQLLNDFGAALEPLAEPIADLADGLNDIAQIVIERLADALGDIATVIAPVAAGLADMINALPPGVLNAAVTSILALAGAFVVLKGVQGVGGALAALGLFPSVATSVASGAGKITSGLKGLAGKAGLFGLAAAGAYLFADALVEGIRQMRDMDGMARNLVATNSSLAASVTKLDSANRVLNQSTGDVLDRLGTFDNFFAYSFGAFDDVGKDAVSLANALKELDKPIADLANVDMSAAVDQFSAYAAELGATDAQVLTMLNNMPEFKAALEAAALAEGGLATDAALVSAALGGTNAAVVVASDGLTTFANTAILTGTQIDDLSEKILNFGSKNLDAREAARQFEESLDTLTESVVANGTTLDIATAQGRANEAALDDIAVATLGLSAATLKQTGDQSAANEVIATGRQRLIEMLGQFGITGAAAEDYADKLGLIDPEVSTSVALTGVQSALDTIANLTRDRTVRINTVMGGAGLDWGGRDVTPFARGGNVFGPTNALIGEAGPEAVVPLNRPLSQVDPSVRWLSAIAQGKAGPSPMASGGIGGTGRQVIFEAGAIVVQGAVDPRQTAYDVLDVVAEHVNS